VLNDGKTAPSDKSSVSSQSLHNWSTVSAAAPPSPITVTYVAPDRPDQSSENLKVLADDETAWMPPPGVRVHELRVRLASMLNYPAHHFIISHQGKLVSDLKELNSLVGQIEVRQHTWNAAPSRMITRPIQKTIPAMDAVIREFTKLYLKLDLEGRNANDASRKQLLLVLAATLAGSGKELLLFNSQEQHTAQDHTPNLHQLFSPETETICLVLADSCGLHKKKGNTDDNHDGKQLADMDLEETTTLKKAVITKLAGKFKLEPERFYDVVLTPGSVKVSFKILALSMMERKTIKARLSTVKETWKKVTEWILHPFFSSVTLDINSFDPRGDKCGYEGHSFMVGPAGNQRLYHQPNRDQMWQRFGIRVLGKYGDDDWLHPFSNNPGLWWRAFHGTMPTAAAILTAKDLKPSKNGKLGPGVYITPHIEYAMCYAGTGSLSLPGISEEKQYLMVMQCAVRPDSILREGFPGFKIFPAMNFNRYGEENSEWTAQREDVRVYGICMIEYKHAEEVVPGLSLEKAKLRKIKRGLNENLNK
jgi:hypothetical protein